MVRSPRLGDLERPGHARGIHARYRSLRAVRLDHVFDDSRREAAKVLLKKVLDASMCELVRLGIFRFRAGKSAGRLSRFGLDRGRTYPIKFLPGQLGGHAAVADVACRRRRSRG